MPDNVSTLDFTGTGNAAVGPLADPIESPFDADISNVTVAASTAPTGADLVCDVLKNGTSIFSTAVATVAGTPNAQGATPAGIGVSDTTIFIEFVGDDEPDIEKGETIVVDSETMQVTSTVNGSSKVDSGTPVYSVTVTRGYDGTVAAAHNQGVSVFPGKPRILAGATSSTGPNLGTLKAGSFGVARGDVLTATITQIGSTVAGAGVGLTVELSQR